MVTDLDSFDYRLAVSQHHYWHGSALSVVLSVAETGTKSAGLHGAGASVRLNMEV